MIIIGAMSGSSLDGLDLAMCSFNHKDEGVQWEVLASETFSFPVSICSKLCQTGSLSVEELEVLAVDLANFTASCVQQIEQWQTCDAVAIHGHTILHQPGFGYSLQITNPWHLSRKLSKPVVADFRNADIALGGQGAPLVPKAELDLFSGYDAFLNLGGIANATYYKEDQVFAYDLFACNQWLNALSAKMGAKFDEDGTLSAQGKTVNEIVDACLTWEFCGKSAPKSLSNQECSLFYENTILPFTQHYSVPDVMKSCIVAMSRVITQSLGHSKSVLVTGGGAYNATLMQVLGQSINIEIPEAQIVEFKEAIAFAYLGFCRLNKLPGNVPNATGASREALLGCLYDF